MTYGELAGIVVLAICIPIFFIVLPLIFFGHRASVGVKSVEKDESGRLLISHEIKKAFSEVVVIGNTLVFKAAPGVKTADIEMVIFNESEKKVAKYLCIEFGGKDSVTIRNFAGNEICGVAIAVRTINGEHKSVSKHVIGPQHWMIIALAIAQSLSVMLGLLFYMLGFNLGPKHPNNFGGMYSLLLLTPIIGAVSYVMNRHLLSITRGRTK